MKVLSKLLLVVFINCCGMLVAQTNDSLSDNLFKPSTSSIINLKPSEEKTIITTAANLSELGIYEAPSIISVITAQEIAELGYPDLLDLLNLLPGIEIASDVQNGTSIGIRGNWANEGKVLFMIDGLQLNDMAYGSIILGQRFPTINISRIEFIRGSGSSIYGGLAGLGVINIITKKGQESNGHSLLLGGGLSKGALSQGRISYNYGGYLLKGIEISITALINAGNRSNETITLFDGTKANMRDSSIINSTHLNFNLKYKGLRFKQLYEDYNWQATYEPIASLCRTSITELSNEFKFKSLNVTPFVNYKWQIPWNTQYGDPAVYDVQNLLTSRTSGGFTTNWNKFKMFKVVGGFQYYNDYARYYRRSLTLNNGMHQVNYNGLAAFVEGNLVTRYVNIFTGVRMDKYANIAPVFVPRIAATKQFKHWHYKLIYGNALKIPTIQNINLSYNNGIKPEYLTEQQVEIGYNTKRFDVAVNAFRTQIKNYILYDYNLTTLAENYKNEPGEATNVGFEVVSNLKLNKFTVSMNYSYYQSLKNDIKPILVDTINVSKGNLAFAKNKLVGRINYKITNKYSVFISNVYRSATSSYVQVDAVTNQFALKEFKPNNLLTIGFQGKGLFGLIDYTISVRNVLNTQLFNLYPNSSGYQPTVDMGRELLIKLLFKL